MRRPLVMAVRFVAIIAVITAAAGVLVCTEASHSRCTFPSTGGWVTQTC